MEMFNADPLMESVPSCQGCLGVLIMWLPAQALALAGEPQNLGSIRARTLLGPHGRPGPSANLPPDLERQAQIVSGSRHPPLALPCRPPVEQLGAPVGVSLDVLRQLLCERRVVNLGWHRRSCSPGCIEILPIRWQAVLQRLSAICDGVAQARHHM